MGHVFIEGPLCLKVLQKIFYSQKIVWWSSTHTRALGSSPDLLKVTEELFNILFTEKNLLKVSINNNIRKTNTI